jgi:hypothetical protein
MRLTNKIGGHIILTVKINQQNVDIKEKEL